MTITIHGEEDDTVHRMAAAFAPYIRQHPQATIEIRRQNSVTIYIRVIDPSLAPIGRGERHEILWHLLRSLPDDDQSQVSLLLALTPEETKTSFASMELDHPVPVGL